jgi:tetratricopeptide (TPR) repeat protein
LVIVGGAGWFGRAFAAYDQARQAAEANDWRHTVQRLEQAVELDPSYRFYRQQLALAYGEMARSDDGFLSLALAQQELLYEQSDSYPPDVAYLACLYWKKGQADRAVDLMRQAISDTPPLSGGLSSYHFGQSTFYFNLGSYLESEGEIDLAMQAYAQVLLANPQMGTSPYWQVSDSRHQVLQVSASAAQQLAEDRNLAAEIAFYSGDFERALELYSAQPANRAGQARSLLAMGDIDQASQLLKALQEDSAFVTQAQVLIEKGRLVQAETSIRKAIAKSAGRPSYYYWWGRIAELQGDAKLAEENYMRAIAMSTAIRTDYANLVGRRQPLPTEQPFCLMIPYPAEDLSEPSLALADLMIAQNDPSRATTVYENLLRHEPYN